MQTPDWLKAEPFAEHWLVRPPLRSLDFHGVARDAGRGQSGGAGANDVRLSVLQPARRAGLQLQVGGPTLRQEQPLPGPGIGILRVTGKRYPKAKHRFALKNLPFMASAGLWRETEGDRPPAFTMLTTVPGPDVEPYHDRQVAVRPPGDWAAWLYLTKPEAERPAGSGDGTRGERLAQPLHVALLPAVQFRWRLSDGIEIVARMQWLARRGAGR